MPITFKFLLHTSSLIVTQLLWTFVVGALSVIRMLDGLISPLTMKLTVTRWYHYTTSMQYILITDPWFWETLSHFQAHEGKTLI